MKLFTTAPDQSLFMALELRNKNGKLAFSNGEKIRHVTVRARDQKGLKAAIERVKQKLGLCADPAGAGKVPAGSGTGTGLGG